jgi:hypothetical protein
MSHARPPDPLGFRCVDSHPGIREYVDAEGNAAPTPPHCRGNGGLSAAIAAITLPAYLKVHLAAARIEPNAVIGPQQMSRYWTQLDPEAPMSLDPSVARRANMLGMSFRTHRLPMCPEQTLQVESSLSMSESTDGQQMPSSSSCPLNAFWRIVVSNTLPKVSCRA